MTARAFGSLVRRRVRILGGKPISIAARAGLPRDAIRSVLRGHLPRLDHTAEICDALGLEFYIGPPRDAEEESSQPGGQRLSVETLSDEELSALRDELARHNAASETVLREILSRLPDAPKPEKVEDNSTLTEQTGEGEVIRFPATRQVDQIDVAVAAGGGAEAEDEAVTERLTFRLDWLKSHGLDPSQCTVVKVQGESMEPTLPEGSAILLDRARRRRRVGGIFVVRTADGVVVKRAGKDNRGRWLLLSDHPAWQPAPWPQDADVIGEVKWMARTL